MLTLTQQDSLINIIRSRGIEFGSDDYDYMVSNSVADTIMNFLNKHEILYTKKLESSDEYRHILYYTYNIEFKLNDKIINLFSYKKEEEQNIKDIVYSLNTLTSLDTVISKELKTKKEKRKELILALFKLAFQT